MCIFISIKIIINQYFSNFTESLINLATIFLPSVWLPTRHLKVFYGIASIRGESTTTVCGVNYELLAVMQWATLCCSRPQTTANNCIRHGWSNLLDTHSWQGSNSWGPPFTGQYLLRPTHPLQGSTSWGPPTLYRAVLPEAHTIKICAASPRKRTTSKLLYTRQPPCQCGHSGYKPRCWWKKKHEYYIIIFKLRFPVEKYLYLF